MDENIYFKVVKYLKNNGLEFNGDNVELEQNDRGIIKISKWTYAIKKPNATDLESISTEEVEEEKEDEKTRRELIHIPCLPPGKINRINKKKNGCLVYNKRDGVLQIFIDGEWKNLSV